jgi:non-ribosomal peptide synthetase component F
MLYRDADIDGLKIQYYDFTEWQTRFSKTERMQRQWEYWQKTLGGELPVLKVPTDSPRPPLLDFKGDMVSFSVGMELRDKIRELESQTGATLFMILLSVYSVLLMKYSGQEDILVGFPVAGRNHADLIRVVGMFVNLITLRSYPENDKTFREFLNETKTNCMTAFENQDVQFDELVERLKIKPDPSRNPIFDVSFMLQNYSEKGGKVKENESRDGNFNVMAHFDLELNVHEMVDGIGFFLVYSTALYKRATAQNMAEHYAEILEQAVYNSDIRLKDIVLAHNLAAVQSSIRLDDEVDFGI